MTETPSRPRRRRGGLQRRRCTRDGCERITGGRHGQDSFCSALCRIAGRVLASSQRVCEAVGPGARAGQYWAAAVTAADALAELQRLDDELAEAARSVGIDGKHWAAIKRGDHQQ